MLMTIEKCPGCGEEIDVHDAPGGLCPVCLMRRGAELANTAGMALQSTPSASPQFEPPNPLELEADLPDFDVIELIGQGGMGAVYKARHRGLDRIVAIKILPRRETADLQLAERFAREVRALARLKHEQIVMAFDAGLTDRYSYFVMEYVEGPNLRQLLAGGALPPARSIEIARDVCEALRYAHENGVVHRDIKPENVLIAPGGRAKLADFGLAKLRDPSDADFFLTATHQLMGTLHYMAPEQTESPQSADDRADLYSLGVLLYEMLTGELPLGVFDPPSSKCNANRRIDEIVLRALAKEPARRFASAAEFAAALVDFAAHDNSALSEGKPATKQTGGRRRIPRRILIAAGFAAAFAIAFWGWQLLIKYQKDSQGNVAMTISAGSDEKTAGKQNEADAIRLKAEEAHRKSGLVEPLLIANCVHCHADLHNYSHGVNYQPISPPAPMAKPAESSQTNGATVPEKPAEKPVESGKSTRPQQYVNLIEIAGPLDSEAEAPAEDLPICLSHPVQEGAYPDKSLTINYGSEVDRVAKDGHYYLVIDGDHIGRHEMPIEAGKFKERGKLRVAKLPEAGDGEPFRIYIEVEKPAFGRSRVRASNIVKTKIAADRAPDRGGGR